MNAVGSPLPGWLHRRPLRRRLVVLALFAFAMQAAVPAGFMLGAVNGHVGYVLCPAGGAVTRHGAMHHAMVAGAMAGMQHASAVSHEGGSAAHAASCPFALASGTALLAYALAVPEPHYTYLRPRAPPPLQSLPAAAPPRYQAPRGPPLAA